MTDEPDSAAAAPVGERKAQLRSVLLARRRSRPAAELAAARTAVADVVLARAAARGWRCVAAYEPMQTEPGSTELLAGLSAAGLRVLVPVTLPDRDLDWARWGSPAGLGANAVGGADAVLVPALAVARHGGVRLGRGGGSYDRALLRCAARAELIALLFDGELVSSLPAQAWDVPVGAVVTPSGYVPVGAVVTPSGYVPLRNTAVAPGG